MKFVNYVADGASLYEHNNHKFMVKNYKTRTSHIGDYINILKENTLKYKFYLYSLYDDETIKEDLTPYLIQGGQLSITNGSGIRRRLSISIVNKNKWSPHPINGFLWKGSKFKLEIGIVTSLAETICSAGVFILSDFDMPHGYISDKINLNLVDKFGALDGTVGGKITSGIGIPVGSKIVDVITTLLKTSKMTGSSYDDKTVLFPIKFLDRTTPYTITKSITTESTVGEIIKEVAMMINQDVYYDIYGRMCFSDIKENIIKNSNATVYSFFDTDSNYESPTIKIDLQAVKNVITVQGANINGNLVDVTLKNTNPKSPTNISVFEPTPLKIVDENIYNLDRATERAEYELARNSIISVSMSFNTKTIPLLDVDNIIEINDKYYGFSCERFLVNSINIPINSTGKMSLTINNLEEVAFNGNRTI